VNSTLTRGVAMRWLRFLGVAALAGGLAVADGPAGGDKFTTDEDSSIRPLGSDGAAAIPPVLRNMERPDDVLVMLPGARVPAVAAPEPPKPAPTIAIIRRDPPAVAEEDLPPVPRKAPKPYYPPDFERDSALYCQRLIAQWSQPDAYNLFGDALRDRPAMEDDQVENGRIYAFSDPTGRYREIELDFAADSGLLRTVFVYPWTMTWKDCLRQWGAKVNTTGVSKGRVFYSYMNRRLDVLVDSAGKVISFGLY
jgi:hypothetical protein